jgi:hypothetical protein
VGEGLDKVEGLDNSNNKVEVEVDQELIRLLLVQEGHQEEASDLRCEKIDMNDIAMKKIIYLFFFNFSDLKL